MPRIEPKIKFISAIDGRPVEPAYLPLDSYTKFKEEFSAKGGARAVAQSATEATINAVEGKDLDIQKIDSKKGMRSS